jgi:hypothetical protein
MATYICQTLVLPNVFQRVTTLICQQRRSEDEEFRASTDLGSNCAARIGEHGLSRIPGRGQLSALCGNRPGQL